MFTCSCNYGNRRSDGGELRVESDSGVNQLQLKYLISVKTYNHMHTLLGLWRKLMQVRDPDVSIRNALSYLLTLSTLNAAVLALYILFTFGFIAVSMASLCPIFSVNAFQTFLWPQWLHHFSCVLMQGWLQNFHVLPWSVLQGPEPLFWLWIGGIS